MGNWIDVMFCLQARAHQEKESLGRVELDMLLGGSTQDAAVREGGEGGGRQSR